MNNTTAAPPSVDADGGGSHRGGTRGQRRRTKNRRYRRNRARRSHITIVSWNAEGLRSKVAELQRWLPAEKADVLAVQEGQLPSKVPRIPGYQPPVVVRRARGRITGAETVRGGDVAIYVRAGLHFAPLDGRFTTAADDTTEVCGIRLLGNHTLDVINIYRPPIRATGDDRIDNFSLDPIPNDSKTLLVGDVNAHHPLWDNSCVEADGIGERIADWMERVGWKPLNDGSPTFASYRTGSQTAPDLAACDHSLARRISWRVGPDLGSDHLPMVMEVRPANQPPCRIRKTRWAHQKADWRAFQDDCEAALTMAEPARSVQELATHVTEAIKRAAIAHIPRGARADPRPWALAPELVEAVAARKTAREQLSADDPASKDRWIAAKRRAKEVEEKVSREHYREFVSKELNQHSSVGKVSKILKKWDRASDDEHREGQAMIEGDRLLVTNKEKAEAFVKSYAHVSRQVRVPRVDREAKKKLAAPEMKNCNECGGEKTGCCAPFTQAELVQQLRRCKLKKAPGPDGISNEMLRHLGPIARSALLHLFNLSWETGMVPREWRAATVIPIPKNGKDKKHVASYRPIALTSQVGKLAERLIQTRISHIVESRGLVPPEQVGFRPGRSVEDNIGRLVQEVQDGWQKPKARSRNQKEEGSTAQRFVLTAYDFARAYDVVDHRLLQLRLLELGLPRCIVRWIWQWLRDRRVRVELNGEVSSERIFRAGLPQGSVLSPGLFLLWAAPLVDLLRQIPGCTPYMYADDTAVLCAGNNIKTARERAQTAADAVNKWAQANKMLVSGEKTQLLVLSQWARDTDDCTIKVGGKTVTAGESLQLLGITLDRLLHFGTHCRRLKSRVRPRLNHLRQLSGRSWGLDEEHLRTVANGYVRGPLEHAAAAWLPATSPSHIETLEREMRAAARIVTGCPRSTPVHALMAEAGLLPVEARRRVLSARLLAKAHALPLEDPLRVAAEATAPTRLTSVAGWRDVGKETWEAADICLPIEPLLPHRIAPWELCEEIRFNLDVGPLPMGATPHQRRQAALLHLGSLPQCATWVWTDGSARDGVQNGGAGVFIDFPDGEHQELRQPAGALCSSYRAELVALRSACQYLLEHPTHLEDPVIFCTDSQSALAALREGPASQTSPLEIEIWEALVRLQRAHTQQIYLQWVPSHCDIPGNERADSVAKDAAALPQEAVPVDVRTAHRAAARVVRAQTIDAWPAGWFSRLMEGHLPPTIRGMDRDAAVDVHQLRAGHWSGSNQYMHRIGRSPTRECQGCNDLHCRAGWCLLCREEADTPEHILLRCPALMGLRLRLTGHIHPTLEEARRDDVVAALGAAARSLQSREAT